MEPEEAMEQQLPPGIIKNAGENRKMREPNYRALQGRKELAVATAAAATHGGVEKDFLFADRTKSIRI